MFIRTFTRTLINSITRNNFLIKSFRSIVNFYYNIFSSGDNNSSFSNNKSILNTEGKNVISFQSVSGDKIDCK